MSLSLCKKWSVKLSSIISHRNGKVKHENASPEYKYSNCAACKAGAIENFHFLMLYFSTQRESGMLHQTQHPAPLSVFSFIQRSIVGHIPQMLHDIAVED